jgi:hypothetical protein
MIHYRSILGTACPAPTVRLSQPSQQESIIFILLMGGCSNTAALGHSPNPSHGHWLGGSCSHVRTQLGSCENRETSRHDFNAPNAQRFRVLCNQHRRYIHGFKDSWFEARLDTPILCFKAVYPWIDNPTVLWFLASSIDQKHSA